MPVLTGPSGVVDLAERLASDLNEGRSARQSYGTRDVAFAWAAGLPSIIARHVSSSTVDGLSFNAVRVAPSGTPAAKVAQGAAKPTAVALTSETLRLNKYAGIATVDTEETLSTEGLVAALAATMTQSCLLAFDADSIAVLTASAGDTVTGTAWTAAILDAIGTLAGNGGTPGLLAISAADYAAAVEAPGVGFAADPTTATTSLFGLAVVISGALPAGTAFVLDPAACMAVENSESPIAVVDPYSGLSTNEIRIAVEMFAAFVVTAPASVVKVTVTGAAGTQSDYDLTA